MEGKPHALVKTEKEFDDRDTMKLAEEKAKKVVVKSKAGEGKGKGTSVQIKSGGGGIKILH